MQKKDQSLIESDARAFPENPSGRRLADPSNWMCVQLIAEAFSKPQTAETKKDGYHLKQIMTSLLRWGHAVLNSNKIHMPNQRTEQITRFEPNNLAVSKTLKDKMLWVDSHGLHIQTQRWAATPLYRRDKHFKGNRTYGRANYENVFHQIYHKSGFASRCHKTKFLRLSRWNREARQTVQAAWPSEDVKDAIMNYGLDRGVFWTGKNIVKRREYEKKEWFYSMINTLTDLFPARYSSQD